MELPDFHIIHIYTHCTIILKKGNSTAINIKAAKSIASKIDYWVSNQVLTITSDKKAREYLVSNQLCPTINITYKNLKGITLTGNGSLRSDGAIIGGSFGIIHEGIGNVCINVEATHLDFTIMRSGKIEVSGFAFTSDVRVFRNGIYDGSALEVEDAEVLIKQGGRAHIWANCDLKAELRDKAILVFKSTPTLKKLSMDKNSMLIMQESHN